jgi:FixJ family two-component response regulator
MAASGALNKDIADRLGISENTVKAHRDRAMDKIQARSLAELVKMIERLAASSALRDTG